MYCQSLSLTFIYAFMRINAESIFLEILSPSDNSYAFLLNVFLIQAWGFTDLVSWNQPSYSISTEMFAY